LAKRGQRGFHNLLVKAKNMATAGHLGAEHQVFTS